MCKVNSLTKIDMAKHIVYLLAIIVKDNPYITWRCKFDSDGKELENGFYIGVELMYSDPIVYFVEDSSYWDMFKCRTLKAVPEELLYSGFASTLDRIEKYVNYDFHKKAF